MFTFPNLFLFQNATSVASLVTGLETTSNDKVSSGAKSQEDIMSVLLAHEKRGGNAIGSAAAAVKAVIPGQPDSASDSSGDEDHKELDASEPGELFNCFNDPSQCSPFMSFTHICLKPIVMWASGNMSNAYVITEFSLKCCYTVLMCIRPWLH
jgi:hypothetical protein